MQIYIPTPVVVDGALQFQAQIQHGGYRLIVTKPSNAPLTLHCSGADGVSVVILHDRYYYDSDDDIHQATYTLPSQQRVTIVWIPRPMNYHHIYIQAPRMLVQFALASDTHTNHTEEEAL